MPKPHRSIWEPKVSDTDRDGLLDFIYSRCIILPYCGCWIWEGWNDGKKDHQGGPFGKIQVAGIPLFTHRTTWELVHGRPVKENMVLDHVKERCGIRLCCNPDHLEEVTSKENTYRGNGVWYGRT